MSNSTNQLSEQQASYYGKLFDMHGANVNAVASAKQIYKDLRYEKLAEVFSLDSDFSLYDVGFGLGHFREFITSRYPNKKIQYGGCEVTPAFVEHCRGIYPDCNFDLFDLSLKPLENSFDYLIFGGTFYHLAGAEPDAFFDYVKRVLLNGWKSAKKGMAFNFLTEHVEYQQDDLFYPSISNLIQFLTKDLSRFFTIHHATPLYEHTICVYHEEYLASLYQNEDFQKYLKNKKF